MNLNDYAVIVRNQFLSSFGHITDDEVFYCFAHGMSAMEAAEHISLSRDAGIAW